MNDTIPINELPKWPRRNSIGHKGDYGTVLILAGSMGMAGAAILSGRAALRSGAGLVRVATPREVQEVVANGSPCYMTLGLPQHADGNFSESFLVLIREWANSADSVAIGPGMGHRPETFALIRSLIRDLSNVPLVIDADALNAIAPMNASLPSRITAPILTPHPGEFSRLTGLPISTIEADRAAIAAEFANRFGVVLVLKGSGTIVTDGKRIYQNSTGNPGMATGGSGDVLTGVIAAIQGQGLLPFEAAVLGVWIHGRAGDLAAGSLGQTAMIAADLPEFLPAAFQEIEE